MDRKASFVGSHNFDPRSFNLNSECGVLIEDPAFSSRLGEIIEKSLHPRNSWALAERRFPPVMQELNALIAAVSGKLPMFDVWPLEHVSAYELKEGGTVLSPYDPEFHLNYTDVGVFPGLNLGTKEVQVQLIRAFGGLSSPLM
jgi:phosphatidylserine/phosphatidylglycerophosphate/cardiolipin synthase-like enzyme